MRVDKWEQDPAALLKDKERVHAIKVHVMNRKLERMREAGLGGDSQQTQWITAARDVDAMYSRG